MKTLIKGVIFDLDGVITDTAEYHFLAWKQLADEEGLDFTRQDNEALRGVSRRESLARLLKGRPIDEETAQAWMARKNGYYRRFLSRISPADLLPGVSDLLDELQQAGILVAVASASRNAPEVVDRLGIRGRLNALAHGGSVQRQKPAPDLFLYTAEQLGLPPATCLVVEDAAAGIAAAHAAGMPAVGLGPPERVGAAELVLPDLAGCRLASLDSAAAWRVSEPVFETERQHHRETILTQGNGYLSTRGTFEERLPGDRQSTLVHGIWDDVPIAFTELANAPDWTALAIMANGRRLDMQAPGISRYARWLDLRRGLLQRRMVWEPEPGCSLEIVFERFPSLADEHLLASRLEITCLDGSADITVLAQIDSHVENQGILHWDRVSQRSRADGAQLAVTTRRSRKVLAMSTRVDGEGEGFRPDPYDCPGCPGFRLEGSLPQGSTLRLEKITAVYNSRDADDPLAAACEAAAGAASFATLLKKHENAWAEFWEEAGVIIEGDNEAQLAVRHALYQLRAAAPTRDERVSIGAKTLSGFGYRGHIFWDNEIFVLPFFTFTQPAIARNMLMYRRHALHGARRKASANGFEGAQYPWESAESGDEVTPTWVPHFDDPKKLVRIWTGDIQIHISADIAYAMHQYWQATGEDEFWAGPGCRVLLETAVFWGSRAESEGERFAIRDVIGPDEYHDHVDNNQFTNFMARWHLQTALDSLDWLEENHPERALALVDELDLSPGRLAHWRRVIDGLIVLQDSDSGLIEQFEGFFGLKDVEWERYAGRTRSMQELLGIEGCTEYKVLKQADVIALLCLLGDQFDEKTWRANWDYYVPITDHEYGSSLGPAMHAWAACKLGMPEAAYDHFMRAARADLLDVRGNAGDGIHAASAGGLWEALVFGFAGMRITPQEPVFKPCLPAHWTRLAFKIAQRRARWQIEISSGEKVKKERLQK